MKKLSMIIIALVAVFALAACGSKKDTTKPVENVYKDGTYTAHSADSGHGYEDATVVITDGKITSVTLRRLNSDGTEVNYDVWNGVADSNGTTRPNLNQFRYDLANTILAQQTTVGVDAIATATRSTTGWLESVADCLDQATE